MSAFARRRRPADVAEDTIDWVHGILEDERGIIIASPPLEATTFVVEGTRWAFNVLYELDEGWQARRRLQALRRHGVPEELSSFKFAPQKSKLAGTIRGSYFVIKHEH